MTNVKPFKAERWYIDRAGEKNFESESFDSRDAASEWLSSRHAGQTLDTIVKIQGFEVRSAWISWNQHVTTDATVHVNGVGDVKVSVNLPDDLKNRIEQYFASVAYDRMRAFLPIEKRADSVVMNPATPGFGGAA